MAILRKLHRGDSAPSLRHAWPRGRKSSDIQLPDHLLGAGAANGPASCPWLTSRGHGQRAFKAGSKGVERCEGLLWYEAGARWFAQTIICCAHSARKPIHTRRLQASHRASGGTWIVASSDLHALKRIDDDHATELRRSRSLGAGRFQLPTSSKILPSCEYPQPIITPATKSTQAAVRLQQTLGSDCVWARGCNWTRCNTMSRLTRRARTFHEKPFLHEFAIPAAFCMSNYCQVPRRSSHFAESFLRSTCVLQHDKGITCETGTPA